MLNFFCLKKFDLNKTFIFLVNIIYFYVIIFLVYFFHFSLFSLVSFKSSSAYTDVYTASKTSLHTSMLDPKHSHKPLAFKQ